MHALKEMLSYCRPCGSSMEKKFIQRYIIPHKPVVDFASNHIITVGTEPNVLWSCHTDTVHRQGLRQKVRIQRNGMLYATSTHSNCLGADDTAGVWVALELIKRQVPGVYVFHYGEEVGCIGAKHIEEHNKDLLKSVNISIALDRRGTTSLVTAQSCMEGCSDVFGMALRNALDMEHELDPNGIWTDNVEYFGIIPENINLSVGYEYAHSPNECLDSRYLQNLVDALSKINYKELPIVRTPRHKIIYKSYVGGYGGWGSFDTITDKNFGAVKSSSELHVLTQLLREYPRQVAKMIQSYGFDVADIIEHLISEETVDEGALMANIVTEEDLWDDYTAIHGYAG